MTAILTLIPRWAWALLVAFLLLSNGVLGFKLASASMELANSQTTIATLETDIAEAATRAAKQAGDLQTKVIEAQNESNKRETVLRSVAASALSESDGLHGDIKELRGQLGKLSHDAAVERAAAVAGVLDQCSRRYQGLAAVADRHASDLKTMIDAWPK